MYLETPAATQASANLHCRSFSEGDSADIRDSISFDERAEDRSDRVGGSEGMIMVRIRGLSGPGIGREVGRRRM